MPAPIDLKKAKMAVIELDDKGQVKKVVDPSIEVQFNPESLKLTYSNSMQGGDQSGGSAMQFVGQSTTKLSFDLWFDVSAPLPKRMQVGGTPDDAPAKDVRKLTSYVVKFMKPVPRETTGSNNEKVTRGVPPAVRFEWGAFQFDGIVESVNETIDFFSPEGHALRSQLSVSMSQQDIPADLLRGADPGSGAPSPGIDLQTPVKAGDSLQSLAGELGAQDDWQDLALINDVEDPRNLDPGTLLTLGG
jgi:hypothetical protein